MVRLIFKMLGVLPAVATVVFPSGAAVRCCQWRVKKKGAGAEGKRKKSYFFAEGGKRRAGGGERRAGECGEFSVFRVQVFSSPSLNIATDKDKEERERERGGEGTLPRNISE
ncbi:MAG: hypothetical protein LBC18_01090 [Opitutaceae bacterium]|jgi:hypothetical protein|nr:hypothetical protein [Opitutaceae bacterium]